MEKQMTHIDDWIDSPSHKDEGERYAKFVFWYFRYPAWAQSAFAPWMKQWLFGFRCVNDVVVS